MQRSGMLSVACTCVRVCTPRFAPSRGGNGRVGFDRRGWEVARNFTIASPRNWPYYFVKEKEAWKKERENNFFSNCALRLIEANEFFSCKTNIVRIIYTSLTISRSGCISIGSTIYHFVIQIENLTRRLNVLLETLDLHGSVTFACSVTEF